jgi:hypothetical protein
MAVMTIPQVKQARQKAYDALKDKGYDPNIQIESKEQFVKIAKDIFGDMPQEVRGTIGLHVYDGTGGMFVGLLERIKDDTLRNAIIDEVTKDDPDPSRHRSTNRYPTKITAGAVSLLILRSGCTGADIRELSRIGSGNTKFTDPLGLPDFMKSPAARGLFIGSKFAG